MYKLIKKSSNKKMFLLQDEAKPTEKAVWFFLAPHTFKFAETVNDGDVFDIQTEKKNLKDYIIRITKSGAPTHETVGASRPAWTPPAKKEPWKPYTKSPEEQEQIRRCNSMTAASVITAALINTGNVKKDDALATLTTVFDEVLAKLEEGLTQKTEETKDEGVVL